MLSWEVDTAVSQKKRKLSKESNPKGHPMKKLFLVLILIYAALLTGVAQTKPTPEAKRVQAAITGVFDGFSGLDFGKVMRHATPDVTILEDGVVWNADSISAALSRRSGADFKRTNSFDFLQTEVRGDLAWTSYYNKADFQIDGRSRRVKWLESAVLVKEKDEWKVKLLHSTVIRPKEGKK